jgi:hypothetical protein
MNDVMMIDDGWKSAGNWDGDWIGERRINVCGAMPILQKKFAKLLFLFEFLESGTVNAI